MILSRGLEHRTTLFVTPGLCLGAMLTAQARAAELLEFDFERNKQRYEVSSVAFIDAPPQGVYAVLTDYAHLYRISNLVAESADLGLDANGQRLVYTFNKGCLALFCRSLEKVERLQSVPYTLITTDALPERSDVNFSHSEWHLHTDGRGTRLEYQLTTDINFWVPPFIGNYLMSRWLEKGARNAVQRIEYFASQTLNGDASLPADQGASDSAPPDAQQAATPRQRP